MSKVLILRVCNKDRASFDGFQWPESGPVECPPPDPKKPGSHWDPKPVFGNGLHGWLWGEGDGYLGTVFPDSRWLVVEVLESDIVYLDGCVKFPKGEVVFCGSRSKAADYLASYDNIYKVIIGRTLAVGDGESAHVGDYGYAMAGDSGVALSGVLGTSVAGNYGLAVTGDQGSAKAGFLSRATAGFRGQAYVDGQGVAVTGTHGKAHAGDSGHATAGDEGSAICGAHGIAKAGEQGKATAGTSGLAEAGYRGTAIVEDRGIAIVGAGGLAQAGNWGVAQAGVGGRLRITIWRSQGFYVLNGIVGTPEGLLPDTPYEIREGQFRALDPSEFQKRIQNHIQSVEKACRMS